MAALRCVTFWVAILGLSLIELSLWSERIADLVVHGLTIPPFVLLLTLWIVAITVCDVTNKKWAQSAQVVSGIILSATFIGLLVKAG